MEKVIGCCGLNCAACDARIATLADDNELRSKTAEKWRVHYNVPSMSPEMINCTGCREPGAKLGHCAECAIRNCAIEKNYHTCADCPELESCDKVRNIHQYVPEALQNLKNLN